MRTNQAIGTKKKGVNKLVLGFAAVAASAIVGTTGLAAAATGGGNVGYGGNNINLDIDMGSSHNNVINIIFNFFH